MEDDKDLAEEVRRLKRERRAVVLAHYYVDGAVQDVADYVGDSYGLAKQAAALDCDEIVFAGVRFMGESAKLLSPDKRVLMPAPDAGCPMAAMADVETIDRVRAAHPGIAVVCYVNSTAAVKAASDVCVTSSNAERIVAALPQRQIFFTPDRHLGHYLSEKLPDKVFILNPGFCPIHEAVQLSEIEEVKRAHPEARVLMHPECPQWVLGEADYVGSTAGIIKQAVEGDAPAYLIPGQALLFPPNPPRLSQHAQGDPAQGARLPARWHGRGAAAARRRVHGRPRRPYAHARPGALGGSHGRA